MKTKFCSHCALNEFCSATSGGPVGGVGAGIADSCFPMFECLPFSQSYGVDAVVVAGCEAAQTFKVRVVGIKRSGIVSRVIIGHGGRQT